MKLKIVRHPGETPEQDVVHIELSTSPGEKPIIFDLHPSQIAMLLAALKGATIANRFAFVLEL